MKAKLTVRRCKFCNEHFKQIQPLQYLCMPPKDCSWKYQNLLKDNKAKKEWRDQKKVLKVETHSKEYKKSLQDEINKLSRMIDEYFEFPCIDCDKFLDKEKHQIDACHLHSRKKNGTIRHNLHNLHSGHNYCNTHNENHESNYKKVLEKRYGNEYLIMVENLPIQYKEVHLSNIEVVEKLAIVRKLIRTFHTYKFQTAIEARNLFNTIIGIY